MSGAHGVLSTLDDAVAGRKTDDAPAFFDRASLDRLRSRQVDALRYVDGIFEKVFDLVPAGTWIVVTSDHGELFGEDDYFGHGPIFHEKVFEVPFVEGMRP